MTLRLDPLPMARMVDVNGRPTQAFQRQMNKAFGAIVEAFNSLSDAFAAIEAAQDAAEAANTAAATANAAATTAATAATSAQTAAASANDAIGDIEAGEFDLMAVKVNGVRFIYDGVGDLVPE